MPRVYLSQEDREKAAMQRIRDNLVDGIVVQKARGRLNNEQVGKNLEIAENTIARIINGADPRLTISQTLRLFRFAGLQIGRIDP